MRESERESERKRDRRSERRNVFYSDGESASCWEWWSVAASQEYFLSKINKYICFFMYYDVLFMWYTHIHMSVFISISTANRLLVCLFMSFRLFLLVIYFSCLSFFTKLSFRTSVFTTLSFWLFLLLTAFLCLTHFVCLSKYFFCYLPSCVFHSLLNWLFDPVSFPLSFSLRLFLL